MTADASGSTDPQGQALTYAFDFGDGTTTGSQSAATADHTYLAAGTYVVTVTVTDADGLVEQRPTSVVRVAGAVGADGEAVGHPGVGDGAGAGDRGRIGHRATRRGRR